MKIKKTTPSSNIFFIGALLLMGQDIRSSDSGNFVGVAGYVVGSAVAGAVLISAGYTVLRIQEAFGLRSAECEKAQAHVTKIEHTYTTSSEHKKLVESIDKATKQLERLPNSEQIREVIGSADLEMLLRYKKNPENSINKEFSEQDIESLKSVLNEFASSDETLDDQARKEVAQFANDFADVIRRSRASDASHQQFIANLSSARQKYSEENSFMRHFQKAGQAPSKEVANGISDPKTALAVGVGTLVAAKVALEVATGGSQK